MKPFTKIGFRINCVNPHVPHHPAYFFSIDQQMIITSKNLSDGSITPGGMGCMDFINSAHHK